MVFIKGVVECVIESCIIIISRDGDVEFFLDLMRVDIICNMEVFVCCGLWVLVFVSCLLFWVVIVDEVCLGILKCEYFENDLVFCGFVGIYDFFWFESWFSVFKCYEVGIVVYMFMGDYFEIVCIIVVEVGILLSWMDFLCVDFVS